MVHKSTLQDMLIVEEDGHKTMAKEDEQLVVASAGLDHGIRDRGISYDFLKNDFFVCTGEELAEEEPCEDMMVEELRPKRDGEELV